MHEEAVEPATKVVSVPLPGRSRGFAGLRVAGAVGLVSALGGLTATGLAVGLSRLDGHASATLAADRDARVEAGRAALESLEPAISASRALEVEATRVAALASSSRARALALELTRELDRLPEEGRAVAVLAALAQVAEREGAIGLALVGSTGGEAPRLLPGTGAATSTPGISREALGRIVALRGSGAGAPVAVLVEGADAFALGPSTVRGEAVLVRAPIDLTPSERARAASGAVARTSGALVNLAEPPRPLVPRESALPLLVAGSLLGALIGALWAWARLGRPLRDSLAMARAAAHGVTGARADETRGGRDARDVARELNALILRGDRLAEPGRGAATEDVLALIGAIEALGRGDLREGPAEDVRRISSADGDGPLPPIAVAVEAARRALESRLGGLHAVTLELASAAGGIEPGAKRIAQAAREEQDALSGLGRAVSAATGELEAANQGLGAALGALGDFAKAERKSVQELRTATRAQGRRVADLRRGVARLEALASTAEPIGEALDLLAGIAEGGGQHDARARGRLTAAVGEARAALEAIEHELALLRDETGGTAAALEALAAGVPEAPPPLDDAVTTSLRDAGGLLVRVAEQTFGALRTLERSTRAIAEASAQIHRGASVTSELAPKIAAQVAAFSVGGAEEERLLEKLQAWKREVEAAQGAPDGLTEEGRALARQVVATAEAARTRLSRLVTAAESAVELLRG